MQGYRDGVILGGILFRGVVDQLLVHQQVELLEELSQENVDGFKTFAFISHGIGYKSREVFLELEGRGDLIEVYKMMRGMDKVNRSYQFPLVE
eukprot:g26812.t1